MNEPQALVKAQTLTRYAQARGAHLSTLQLTISDAEGLELLDWLLGEQPNPHPALIVDVELAHRAANPWPVLEHFRLLGLELAPRALLH